MIFVTVGSIVQSVNGPNLVISELTNNLNIIQCATAKFNNISFTAPLKSFIRRLFSSKRRAFPILTSTNEIKSIHLGRKLQLPNDHIVMVYLRDNLAPNVSVHRTCWKNNVQFSIHVPNSSSKNCDSCVLFKEQNQVKCGFIASIASDSNQECNVIVHTVYINREDSLTFKSRNIINPFIFFGQLTDPPHLVTVHIDDILVKIAYTKQDIFHFFQFPNTVEST